MDLYSIYTHIQRMVQKLRNSDSNEAIDVLKRNEALFALHTSLLFVESCFGFNLHDSYSFEASNGSKTRENEASLPHT